MDKKNIIGLDLGTNSIGWSIIRATKNEDHEFCASEIVNANSRIIPVDAAIQGDFARGNSISQTADRTRYRGVRRLHERSLLRRERLHRVLGILGFLPKHYQESLTRYGKFKDNTECRLTWTTDESGKQQFIFRQSYEEMLQLFWQEHPDLMEQ